MSRLAVVRIVLILLLFIVSRSPASAVEDWPQWRGPRGDGTSLETDLPTHWSATDNIAWKTPIPGKGHSSPIIVGDRLFVTTCLEDTEQRMLLCLNRADGKVVWQREVLKSPREHKHDLNSYASATPCSDGRHVWVSFFQQPRIELACYDMDGNETWRQSPGTFASMHGFCSSPVMYKDLIILNCDQDAPAYIVAYDKNTGHERWRTDRPNRTRSYCTPTIFDVDGRKQMMLSGSKCVASYDPDTGKQIWLIDGPTEQFVASLVMTDGVVFMTGGFPELHLLGIDPTGRGNVTKSKILWHDHKAVSYVPSPVAAGHWFFLSSDDGIGTCWEAKTGKLLWKHRLGGHQSASAVVANGLVYFTDDAGLTTIFKNAPTFEQLTQNSLGEEVRASPAISRGKIFIRARNNLYCIGKASEQASR